jgi:hypothetical protein
MTRLRRIAHLHASVAHRVADLALVLGAVNVNETAARVGAVFIQALKLKIRDGPNPSLEEADRQTPGFSRPIYFA